MKAINFFLERRYRVLVLIFFALFFCLGTSIYKDYGISWDEYRQRQTGLTTVRYVFQNNPALLTYSDRYYGAAFEVLLIAIEVFLKLSDIRTVYLMRHLVNFLAFYISVFFFYKLCKNRFNSYKIGLLGALFLILSPRIFADSFYNSKDLVFLSVFIISIYTLILYLNKKTLLTAIAHAIVCAFLVDTRIMGVIVPFFTIFFIFTDYLLAKTHKIDKKNILNFVVYLFILCIFTIMFWPTLWNRPLHQFVRACMLMSRYPWKGGVFYFGHDIKAAYLPWHYIPVWIAITTPIVYIIFFFFGLYTSLKRLLINPIQFYFQRRNDVIFMAWFFLPLISVISFRSVVYDGWRHLYFIYPAFLLISLVGLLSFLKTIKNKFKGAVYKFTNWTIILIVAASIINVARFMIRFHPYQNVYFNMLVGTMRNAKKTFELDYWGLSYRQALEYILKHDQDKTIKIFVESPPGWKNVSILHSKERKRLVLAKKIEDAKYFLSNYRWHEEEYSYKNEFYSITIDGAKIMVVYKL
ncbi:MAG: glycosyltransferase family 39 protein [Candidatus Omnitrophota bacterium]|nr:glycosyltransferase family 39 protein [Candidatus Omnitrophota bacterium]